MKGPPNKIGTGVRAGPLLFGLLFAHVESVTPNAYPANASAGTIGAYSIRSRNFELQRRVAADLHAAICSSLGSVTLNEINSKHQFGTGSLSPLNLVTELKAMFGAITKQEIDATQSIISAPLAHFL